jgi:CBS domain-containing protein
MLAACCCESGMAIAKSGEANMLTIADIMTQTVQMLNRMDTVADAILQMQTHGLRSLIVDRVAVEMPYGILTERDIVYKVFARGIDPARVRVQDIMRQPCIALEPHLTLREAAIIMSESGIQRAPVLHQGELLGIVSVTDLVMKGYVLSPALSS